MILEKSSDRKNADWAVVIPLSNESETLGQLTDKLRTVLNSMDTGTVYFVIDQSSSDTTFRDAQEVSLCDGRFQVLWRPEVKNVVQAYLAGFSHACAKNHDIIIEMDGGMAHDPRAIPEFLAEFDKDLDCVFGSRFCEGGGLHGASASRMFLSRGGTLVTNFLLGTKMSDMTSGFQGFRRDVLEWLLAYPLRSTGHFYQTEVRYLLRGTRFSEVPIQYESDGRNVSGQSLKNAVFSLGYYFFRRAFRLIERVLTDPKNSIRYDVKIRDSR